MPPLEFVFDPAQGKLMPLADPLSFQLYSSRNFPPLDEQLRTIAAAGFTNVEPYGPFYEDVSAARQLLARHGLTAKSGHFGLASVEDEPQSVLAIARALGIGIVVAPYLGPGERPTTAADWAGLGHRLARAAAWFGEKGLRLAWHNHDFEFVALPDGSYPIEHLLAEGVSWEADIAWIVKAKADPRPWIARYRGRIPLVHVKDIAPRGQNTAEDGWADVGRGVVAWQELWPLCVEAGAEAMIAEHDNPSDAGRFARNSAEAMRKLAKGGI
jgi:sugar phosphate isomerase/epimerase